ncbi:MAG: Mov34/MPN/PAD-1 family protein [Candidatus Diapherotrites archaeon]
MYSIKKGTLESLLEAAQNVYPNEFFALLGGDKEKKIIDEFIVVPAVYGKTHAIYWPHMVPFDRRILGSVHSHPSRNANPSGADLRGFSRKGEVHLILSYPFGERDFRVFDSYGKEEDIKII